MKNPIKPLAELLDSVWDIEGFCARNAMSGLMPPSVSTRKAAVTVMVRQACAVLVEVLTTSVGNPATASVARTFC